MVLLTIKEYLRVGQQGILENDDFQHTPLPTHTLDITVKGKTNPNEGWTIFKKKDTMEEETIPREAWTISLPLTVFFVSIVYFAIAASFYFE